MKWLLIVLLVLPLLLLLVGQQGGLRGTAPSNLGLLEGKFKPPSKTSNSVSSQADLWPDHPLRDAARIAPLAAPAGGAQTLARLQTLVQAMPGAKVVKAEPGYFYATFTSRWLKFTDDVEFWWDEAAGVVQVRSASRLGEKDLGVNRARIEAIRVQLAA